MSGGLNWAITEPSLIFYHRMDDRLRMDHHVDLSGSRSNSQRASMISRALFIMVAESIGDLWPHVPGRVGQGLGHGHLCQLLVA